MSAADWFQVANQIVLLVVLFLTQRKAGIAAASDKLIDLLNKTIATLETNLKDKDATIKDLTDSVAKKDEKISQFTNQIQELNALIVSMRIKEQRSGTTDNRRS